MFLFNLLLTMLALYLAKKEYDSGRIEWAMFWSALVGWDLHTLIYIL